MSIFISGGGGAGGGATNLNGLTDVNITSVANGQIIAYNNTSGQWENQTGITGGLTYKGAFNATAGTPSLNNAVQGDFYVIDTPSVGTLYGQNWNIGDHLLINADMGGSITASKIDKVDNTDQVTSVNGSTGAITGLLTAANNLSDLSNVPDARSALSLGSAALQDTGTSSNNVVQLDGSSRLPAVDGSQLTNLPAAPVTSVNGATGAVNIYADDTTLNIDGTGLVLSGTGATSTLNADVGTGANQLVQLDGSSRLPAVDGSQLTNLPAAPVTSVNGSTGVVNIYADDTTLNIDGTGLVLSGTGATSTLNADVGTGANQLVQLDGSSRLPAVDGSQLTNLPSGGATRPVVRSVSADTTIGADVTIPTTELERVYIVNTSSAVNMTLPQITGNVGNGYKLNIKRDGSNACTITPNAADNIDGGTDGAAITLSVDKSAFTLVCDGTNWHII